MKRLIRNIRSGRSILNLDQNIVCASVFTVFKSLSLVLIWASASVSFATQQNFAPQTVIVSITPITVLALSGDPQPFVLENYGASSPPYFHDRTTSYSLTTHENNVVLRAQIDAPLPPGVNLTIAAEPSLGIGTGEQELTGARHPVDLVIAIGPGLENNRVLQYDIHFDNTFRHVGLLERKVTVSLCVSDMSRCSEQSQTIVLGWESPQSN